MTTKTKTTSGTGRIYFLRLLNATSVGDWAIECAGSYGRWYASRARAMAAIEDDATAQPDAHGNRCTLILEEWTATLVDGNSNDDLRPATQAEVEESLRDEMLGLDSGGMFQAAEGICYVQHGRKVGEQEVHGRAPHAIGTYYIAPADRPDDEHACGFDANSFATFEDAADELPRLGAVLNCAPESFVICRRGGAE
jgi:hypothetical protein